MYARVSSSSPALITDPNPPRRFGHRNAIVAPPNSAPNTNSDATSERRKNPRRLKGLAGGRPGPPKGRGPRGGAPLPLGLPRPGERQPEEDREQVDHHDHHDDREGA